MGNPEGVLVVGGIGLVDLLTSFGSRVSVLLAVAALGAAGVPVLVLALVLAAAAAEAAAGLMLAPRTGGMVLLLLLAAELVLLSATGLVGLLICTSSSIVPEPPVMNAE
jgi:hypothetical protein